MLYMYVYKNGVFWLYFKFFIIVDISLIKINIDWFCMDLYDILM